MDLGIIIPLVVLAIVVPVVAVWTRQRFQDGANAASDALSTAPAARLTSGALRDLPSPPWRIVYEIADDRLSGIDHVLIGPAGIFGLQTSMAAMPDPPTAEPDARALAEPAIRRGALDDALLRCAMTSTALVHVHWGRRDDGDSASHVELTPGELAVEGRSLDVWAGGIEDEVLSPAQVDLAWQAVVTSIGRPDPLS